MANKVNIIVPIYNAEKYLRETLDSLTAQTIKDIEILCINDGSTDNSLAILEEYEAKFPNLIKIYSKANGGIADARNFGLSKVSSPYFGFLDSDDTVEPNMFETLYNKAIEEESDVVFSDFYWSYPDNENIVKDGPYSDNKEILTSMFATLWNKLYRTEFIKGLNIDFPTGYRYEDASFLYKITPYIQKWSYVATPFVHYRQTAGSITHNHNERVKDMIHVFEDLIKFYKERNHYLSYEKELEFLFIRFFLGNSFLRSCQIKDKKDRKLTLDLSYKILHDHFPKWKGNPHLNEPGLKNKYYKTVNKFTYPMYANIFHLLYKFKDESVFK